MGASLQGGSSGGGRRRRGRNQPMSEINVTPFVDVMLVLLIIFMVAAPLLTAGVPIELPKGEGQQLSTEGQPLTVQVDKEGRIYLQDTLVPLDEIVPKLVAIAKSGYDERVFVRGDRGADYGAVLTVMGKLNAAGFRRIALVNEPQ